MVNNYNNMKAYQIQCGGETDTVAASNVLQAVLFYIKETGLEMSDFESYNDILEIPEEKWDEIKIIDEDTGLTISLRETIVGISQPCIICSTAY
jgi:hypothetical protein